MSIITSNQQKRQTTIDPIFILFVSVLLVLLVFAISATANGNSLLEKVLLTRDSVPASVSLNAQVSFAADQLYWSENCQSGWSADATCDAIVARAQSCSISVDSAYCSAYESYLQEFNH